MQKKRLFCSVSASHLCAQIFLVSAFFALLPRPLAAKTYTTTPLSFVDQSLQSLSWTLAPGPNSSAAATPLFALAAQDIAQSVWQPLSTYTCSTDNDYKQTCSLPLTELHFSSPTRLQFQYPDNHSFYLNFTLPEASSTTDLVSPSQSLIYGPIKNLASDLTPTQLSWQETAYDSLNQATSSTNRLLVQYRTQNKDSSTWNDWQGNFTLLQTLPEALIDSTTSSLLSDKLEVLPSSSWLHLQYLNFSDTPLILSYQDNQESTFAALPHQQLALSQPAANGDTESTAFTQTTFYLDNLANLQIGQDLILRETVNGSQYQAQGTIIDLKKSTGLVTLDSWHGAIPLQTEPVCYTANDHFCFSAQAQVIPVEDFFLSLAGNSPHQLSNLLLTTSQPFTAKILALETGAITPALCLEAHGDLCPLQALNFDFANPPAALQYRVINFDPQTVRLENIFLHQVSTQSAGNTVSYLRHGKKLDSSGVARAYYW